MADHKPGYIVAVLFTIVVYIAGVVVNTLNVIPRGRDIGLVENSPDDLIVKYYVEVVPAAWTYTAMFISITAYQGLWLLYGCCTLSRRNNTYMEYVYVKPDFMPVSVYIVFALGVMASIAWILLFDREYLLIALGLVAVTTLLLWVALAISLRALYWEGSALLRLGQTRDIALTRGLVQNGISHFATWAFVSMHHFLAMTLTHEAGMTSRDSSTLVLGILGLFLVLYFLLDTMVMDRYSRYVAVPYLTVTVSLVGTAVASWPLGGRNPIIASILAGVAFFGFLAKLVLICGGCRQQKEGGSNGK